MIYDTGISSVSYSLVPCPAGKPKSQSPRAFCRVVGDSFWNLVPMLDLDSETIGTWRKSSQFAQINCVKSFGSTTTTTMSRGRDFAPPNFSPPMEFCMGSLPAGHVASHRRSA